MSSSFAIKHDRWLDSGNPLDHSGSEVDCQGATASTSCPNCDEGPRLANAHGGPYDGKRPFCGDCGELRQDAATLTVIFCDHEVMPGYECDQCGTPAPEEDREGRDDYGD